MLVGCTLLPFGAWHSFTDNIARWNEIHPERRFSLIEVTPIALKHSRADLCDHRATLPKSTIEVNTADFVHDILFEDE